MRCRWRRQPAESDRKDRPSGPREAAMTNTHRADAHGIHAEVVMQSLDLAGGTHRLDADFGYDPADLVAVPQVP